jgi:hypothetical protein
VRDQTHTAAGLTPLRFTHAQVAFEPGHVQGTLAAVRIGSDGCLRGLGVHSPPNTAATMIHGGDSP